MDELSPRDRIAVNDLVARHGHLMDFGEFDRLDELFTADVSYDLTAYGYGVLTGRQAIRDAGLALGDGNPVGHHVTNTIVTEVAGDVVRTVSKGIGVMSDGTAGSVVYEDEIRREPQGWRIARRTVTPRRRPLQR